MAGNAPALDRLSAHHQGVAGAKKDPDLDQRCTAKTAKGKQCRNRPIPGLKKCAVHSSSAKAKSSAQNQKAPAHRPDTITEDRTEKMERMLKSGQYVSVACQVIGIPYSTHKDWMKKGQPAEDGNDDPELAVYRAYAERIETATAIGEDNLVTAVSAAAVEDWRAAMTMLERRFPERWAKPSQRVHENSAPDQPTGNGEPTLGQILAEQRKAGKAAGQG